MACSDSNQSEVGHISNSKVTSPKLNEKFNLTVNCSASSIDDIANCSDGLLELHLMTVWLYVVREYINNDYFINKYKDFRYYFLEGIEKLAIGDDELGIENLKKYLKQLESINTSDFEDMINVDYQGITDSSSSEIKSIIKDMTLENCRNSISKGIAEKIIEYKNGSIKKNEMYIFLKSIDTTPKINDLPDIINFIINGQEVQYENSKNVFYMGGLDLFGDRKIDRYYLSVQISILEKYRLMLIEKNIEQVYNNSFLNKDFIKNNGLTSILPIMHYFEYKLLVLGDYDRTLLDWLYSLQQFYLDTFSPSNGYPPLKITYSEWFKYYMEYENLESENGMIREIPKLMREYSSNNYLKISQIISNHSKSTSSLDSIEYYNALNTLINRKLYKDIPTEKLKNSFFPIPIDTIFVKFSSLYKNNSKNDNTISMLKEIGGSFFNLLNSMKHVNTKSYLQQYKQVLKTKGDNGELVLYPIINSFDIYWDVEAGKGNISSE